MATWSDYESLKRAWILKNPNATNQDYSNAMMRICRKLGI